MYIDPSGLRLGGINGIHGNEEEKINALIEFELEKARNRGFSLTTDKKLGDYIEYYKYFKAFSNAVVYLMRSENAQEGFRKIQEDRSKCLRKIILVDWKPKGYKNEEMNDYNGMPSNNSKYTPEIREQTARYVLENGKSATIVAEEMGIDTEL